MKLLFLVPLLVLPLMATAQTVSHQHATTPGNMIDGAKNPELIPDLTAWRLWLLSVTANDNDGTPAHATERHHALLRSVGIGNDELVLADEALAHFRADYQALIDNYNKQVGAGENPSQAQLRAQRDALIQATQTSLLGALSPHTVGVLKVAISHEKRNMKVTLEDQP